MAQYDDGGSYGRQPRQMVDVSGMNLSCANCGTAVTELPFEPKNDRPVYCRNCNRERRDSRPSGGAPRERQLYDVSSMGLKCANCGNAITQLPFQPSNDRPVYCRDCLRQQRDSR